MERNEIIKKIGSGETTNLYEKQVIANYLRNLKEEEVGNMKPLEDLFKKASKEDLTDAEVEFIARLYLINCFELYELVDITINYFLLKKLPALDEYITENNNRRIDATIMLVGNKDYRMTGDVFGFYYNKLKSKNEDELIKEEKDYLNYEYKSSFRKQKLNQKVIKMEDYLK